MATPFRLKRSAIEGKRPTLSDLQLGELALNTYDGFLYTEREGVGLTTVTNLTPWTEAYGGLSIHYDNSVGIGTTVPLSKLDVRGSIGGFDNLGAPHSDTVKILTVIVASKTNDHRYNGQGSSLGYKIDGVESPFLTLTPGRTYRFDQSDGTNSGHPINFYLESDKTTTYSTGVTVNGSAGNAGAYTQIVVGDETPVVLHYQCTNHGYMGNAIQSNANVLNTNYAATIRNSLDISGSFSGFDDLRAPHSDTVITYTVVVASKDSTHRYQGQGSGLGYKIDGVFSPFLTLTPGRTYRFDQSDSSNSGHPINFYLEADKTTNYSTGVTVNGTAGNSGAYTQIAVGDETPIVLHYQCTNHGYMGNAVQNNSNVVNSNYAAILRGGLSVTGGETTLSSATVSDLTSGRVVIVGGSGALQDSGNLVFNGTDLSAASLIVSDLTSGRVVLAGGSGAVEDSGNLTFNGTLLNVTGNVTASGTITANTFVGDGSSLTGINTALGNGSLNSTGIATFSRLSTGASGTGVNITTNSITGPAELFIDPAAVGDNTGKVRIKGDLFVDGTTFSVHEGDIEFGDFVVGIASTVPSNALLDGAGIGIGSTGNRKFLTFSNSSEALKSSEHFDLASGKRYKINGTGVLSANALGSGVVSSSLTSLGTLSSLTVSGGAVVGSGVTLNATGVIATGVVTATSFSGDGSNLTGIDASSLSFGGSVKAQANGFGVVVTGVTTSSGGFSGNLTGNVTGTASLATDLAINGTNQILYQDSNNDTDILDTGNAGQILQSNGAGAAPTWVTSAPAGAIEGISIRDESTLVGTANSISTINFLGSVVTADTAVGAGIATVTINAIAGLGVSEGSGSKATGATGLDFVGPIVSVDAVSNTGISTVRVDALTIKDEGSTVGTAGSITTINFVGSGIAAAVSGDTATVTSSGASTDDVVALAIALG